MCVYVRGSRQCIPTELLKDVDALPPPSDQDAGEEVQFLLKQEEQLKLHILSLRYGQFVRSRALACARLLPTPHDLNISRKKPRLEMGQRHVREAVRE